MLYSTYQWAQMMSTRGGVPPFPDMNEESQVMPLPDDDGAGEPRNEPVASNCGHNANARATVMLDWLGSSGSLKPSRIFEDPTAADGPGSPYNSQSPQTIGTY